MTFRTLLLVAALPTSAAAQQPAKGDKTDFAHDVVPILKAKCAKCHTNGTYKGGISFDTRAEFVASKVVVPGKSADSELVKRVTHADPEMRMPPKADPLTEKEVRVLKAWIDDGLPWEAGFTFKPATYVAPLKPRKVTLPAAVNGRDHPIDRILDAYSAANKLTPP